MTGNLLEFFSGGKGTIAGNEPLTRNIDHYSMVFECDFIAFTQSKLRDHALQQTNNEATRLTHTTNHRIGYGSNRALILRGDSL